MNHGLDASDIDKSISTIDQLMCGGDKRDSWDSAQKIFSPSLKHTPTTPSIQFVQSKPPHQATTQSNLLIPSLLFFAHICQHSRLHHRHTPQEQGRAETSFARLRRCPSEELVGARAQVLMEVRRGREPRRIILLRNGNYNNQNRLTPLHLYSVCFIFMVDFEFPDYLQCSNISYPLTT
jgi:hypothetical protein